MDPEIPIIVKDDEALTRAFRMRQMKPGVVIPKGTKITEANLEEYTEPYDLTGRKIVCTVRTEKKSDTFVPLVLDSDVDGLLIIDPADGLWKFNVDKVILARFVGREGLFYSIVITSDGVPDRKWAGEFRVERR